MILDFYTEEKPKLFCTNLTSQDTLLNLRAESKRSSVNTLYSDIEQAHEWEMMKPQNDEFEWTNWLEKELSVLDQLTLSVPAAPFETLQRRVDTCLKRNESVDKSFKSKISSHENLKSQNSLDKSFKSNICVDNENTLKSNICLDNVNIIKRKNSHDTTLNRKPSLSEKTPVGTLSRKATLTKMARSHKRGYSCPDDGKPFQEESEWSSYSHYAPNQNMETEEPLGYYYYDTPASYSFEHDCVLDDNIVRQNRIMSELLLLVHMSKKAILPPLANTWEKITGQRLKASRSQELNALYHHLRQELLSIPGMPTANLEFYLDIRKGTGMDVLVQKYVHQG